MKLYGCPVVIEQTHNQQNARHTKKKQQKQSMVDGMKAVSQKGFPPQTHLSCCFFIIIPLL
jgi:hypothetical protein